MSDVTLKTLQVLRTKVPLKTRSGVKVPVKTRVVVMSSDRVSEILGKDVVKVKISDPDHTELAGQWFTAAPKAFNLTQRGRPVGSTNVTPAPETTEAA